MCPGDNPSAWVRCAAAGEQGTASYRTPVDSACIHTQFNAFTASEELPTGCSRRSRPPPNMFAGGLA
eukprot:6921665-Prymnesium_polylepis.1